MILEAILSSVSEDGKVNFAPVGVHVPDDTFRLSEVKEMAMFLYSGSHSFANLKAKPEGVINFTDDVLSFVDTALFSALPQTVPSYRVAPPRMTGAKAVWEFAVTRFDDSIKPAKANGRILFFEETAGFTGFCRAHGIILEAAIMATRLQWVRPGEIEKSWPLWQEVVKKTGGIREQKAFRKINDYLVQKEISIPNSLE
ncbi:MAG: DUF447 family protein [Peptococcaceae bacterium]|nr:DUF447 family protein [Peptococcaceae bacterium]